MFVAFHLSITRLALSTLASLGRRDSAAPPAKTGVEENCGASQVCKMRFFRQSCLP